MQPQQDLPIPRDVPWRLAATTQKRQIDTADPLGSESTVSLFYYVPDSESLAKDYSEERVIYLKAVVSICPAKMHGAMWPNAEEPQVLIQDYLSDMTGVRHALLDLSVTPGPTHAVPGVPPSDVDPIRPYIHAVAPVSRELIETGVIGKDQSEGASNSVAMGKSATQLEESIRSAVQTKSSESSADIGILGGSRNSTQTTIATDRTLHEVIDSTYREASQERRELLSHHTNISNVLSLLKALHVGSPYTRFSMWPRPIALLALDPGDPNLWYTELLRQRSSGLEGIQDFVLVVVVPKHQSFCISADLKRFLVADQPPEPPDLHHSAYSGKAVQESLVVENLNRRFPPGTPLDDLDIDLNIDTTKYPRAVVVAWQISPEQAPSGSFPGSTDVVFVRFRSPAAMIPSKMESWTWVTSQPPGFGMAQYKMASEVYLEAVMAKYEAELARSPLERGVLLIKSTKLQTCFFTHPEETFTVGSFEEGTEDTIHSFGGQGEGNGYQPYMHYPSQQPFSWPESPARRGRAAVARWNQAQLAFSKHVESIRDWTLRPIDLADRVVLSVLLAAVARLEPSDPRNLPLTELAHRLDLPDQARTQLLRSGLTRFSDLARYLSVTPLSEASTGPAAEPIKRRGRWHRPERILPDTPPPLLLDRETRDFVIAAIQTRWSGSASHDRGAEESS